MLIASPAAAAHDDLASPGALHAWLPQAPWVLEHWLPFDRVRL